MWKEENLPVMDQRFSLQHLGHSSKKLFGFGVEDAFIVSQEGFTASFYVSDRDCRPFAGGGFVFFTDRERFCRYLEDKQTVEQRLLDHIKDIVARDLSALSNGELFKAFEELCKKIANAFEFYAITEQEAVQLIEEKLEAELTSSGLDAKALIPILTSPDKIIELTEKGHQLFDLSLSKSIKGEDSRIDPGLLRSLLFTIKNEVCQDRLAIIQKHGIPQKAVELSDIFRSLGHERLRLRYVFMQGLFCRGLFFNEIVRRIGITKKELYFYNADEVKTLVLDGEKVPTPTIERRKRGYVSILTNGDIFHLEGDDALAFTKEHIQPVEKTDILHGTVACKGTARGRVITFRFDESDHHLEKMDTMEAGQIIVTEQTHPNILTAIDKAAAIVTDEGGMLCHAAIVSRERRIPCVIGTRFATANLKDGDLVEVNAIEGWVRRLGGNPENGFSSK